MLKKLLVTILCLGALIGCNEDDAKVASRNLSKAADNFEVARRVIFYNGITNDYMLVIEGRCSIDNGSTARSITVTCKLGKDEFKKHLLGLSDNVTYFVEQLKPIDVSVNFYRVTFKPTTILPDIDIRGPGLNTK